MWGTFPLYHSTLTVCLFADMHCPQGLLARVELQEFMHVNKMLISAAKNCNSMGIVSKPCTVRGRKGRTDTLFCAGPRFASGVLFDDRY